LKINYKYKIYNNNFIPNDSRMDYSSVSLDILSRNILIYRTFLFELNYAKILVIGFENFQELYTIKRRFLV
jgi:hypothetical protein